MRFLLYLLASGLFAQTLCAQTYDLVIANGRVIDPETRLDSNRWIGISSGTIRAVSEKPLRGRTDIDAKGLVVAPGFIDLHEHGQDFEAYTFQARDGVTSSFELEVGTADVAGWYAARERKSAINHGVSIGHVPVRMKVMKDPGDFLPSGSGAHQPATEEQISEMKQLMERGFREGAVSAGLGITYTPAATRWEILEMFRVASRFKASCHVHLRTSADISEPEEGLEEVLAASSITGAPLHVVHINSSSLQHAPHMLQMISEARARGLDVTTEMYPYTAGSTRIDSARFDGWMDRPEADYHNIQWVATGERLTKASFRGYRKQGGLVILFNNTEEIIDLILRNPLPMIASDGFGYETGTSHPRSAGTYSRILGVYVREKKVLPLNDAIRRMTLMPAQRLEARVPAMKKKGRIQPGCDADITIFDPATVHDRSTYEKGKVPSEGIRWVLVGGTFVVRDGKLVDGATPGKAIRALVAQFWWLSNDMPKIVVPDDSPPVLANSPAFQELLTLGDVAHFSSLPNSQAELIERIRQAEIVINIRSSCRFSSEVFAQCPKLQLLSVWGTGTDNVDLVAAARSNVMVTNTPRVSAFSVAEHALALMLAVAHGIASQNAAVREGHWPRGQAIELRNKTLGIIGLGAIGTRFAELGQAIGMRVIAWTINPKPAAGVTLVEFDNLLRTSDVVSVHVRLSPRTQGLIGMREFELMKKSAILVNTARGAILDERALVEVLEDCRIAGAGLDVFATEPLPSGHPLTKLPNVVLTPHSAGITPEALDAGLRMAVENVRNFLRAAISQPPGAPNVVVPRRQESSHPL